MTIEVRLRVEGVDGLLAEDSASDTATLTIDADGVDASEYGAVGGSGSLTAETA